MTVALKLKDTFFLKEKRWELRQRIKKQWHHFANKGPYNQSYHFSSSYVRMWKLDHKEGWAPKNWCFWTVVLEKTLESSLDSKEIKPVNPKGNQPWIFIARSDAEAETPVFWPPDAKNWLIGKDPDAGKDRRQEEKGTTEDEMVGWHHRLNGHEFEQASGIGDGPGSLACFSSWGHNWVTELNDPAIPLLDLYMQRKLNQYLEDICSPPCSLQHCNSQQTEMEIA